MIRAILACDNNWGIGKNGDLPWPQNKQDLKWFKETTTGKVVVMGKSTWDSLPDNSKPLPNRNNVVVTRSKNDKNGPYHFLTFDQAQSHLQSMNLLQDVWIIGGAQLVESLLDIIEEIWLSRIQGVYDCDTFLPSEKIKSNYILKSIETQNSLVIEKWTKV